MIHLSTLFLYMLKWSIEIHVIVWAEWSLNFHYYVDSCFHTYSLTGLGLHSCRHWLFIFSVGYLVLHVQVLKYLLLHDKPFMVGFFWLLLLLQDASGQKMINEYVKECTIGHGSYGKVVRPLINCQKIIVSQVIFKMFFLLKLRWYFHF